MKAYVINQFGSPTIFQPIDIAKPEVQPGHVLIRVAATSVNPVDYKIRSGAVAEIAPEFPAVLHGDVAGVVEAVGENVSQFKPGDEVYACAGGVKGLGGALAEYMLA
ncbi:MAG: alcohol dehydrogenase catalytic domain-containing protein, partial [Cyanobacteriota bacterium]